MALVADGESIRAVADALLISPSCVSKWSLRLRETGSVAPAQMGGYKPKVLSGERADWLRTRISSEPFTLRGLVLELAELGINADYRSVWEFVHQEGLSFKKKRYAKRANKA